MKAPRRLRILIAALAAATLPALAVSTTRRSASLPDVPTTAEAGLVDAGCTFWNGLFAPSTTPREIVDRLHHEIQKILVMPNVRESMTQPGVEPHVLTPAEFDALVRKEIDISATLVNAAGLQLD